MGWFKFPPWKKSGESTADALKPQKLGEGPPIPWSLGEMMGVLIGREIDAEVDLGRDHRAWWDSLSLREKRYEEFRRKQRGGH